MTNKSNFYPDLVAAVVLTSLAIFLFRWHFIGDNTWIGNPDRLNNDLKILKHYLSGAAGGDIAAWNEHEMAGYDTFALPYTFPNPLVWIIGSLGPERMYVAMGYVVMVMLAAAGLAAYGFLRTEFPAGLPSLIGAICYEFSSLTILKVSQNSMSFAVFIAIPLVLLCIRYVRTDTATRAFLALAILLSTMLSLMFLQKVAYAILLAGLYAGWRSLTCRTWLPVAAYGAALTVATTFSLPRLLGVGIALSEYARVMTGRDLTDFDVLYEFQNIRPHELLRWLDNTIFGRSPSDSVAIGNNINLSEGFLLYTSTIVPLLLLTGLVRHPLQWTNVFRAPRHEASFFFWILTACVAVIAFKPVAYALFVLFLRIDFTHARILICALLPLCFLVAMALTDISRRATGNDRNGRIVAIGMAAGVMTVFAMELFARSSAGTVETSDFPALHRRLARWGIDVAHLYGDLPEVRRESLARITLSATWYGAILVLALVTKSVWIRSLAYGAICSFLATQCWLGANEQVNGAHTFDASQPFKHGDFYYADRREFRLPTTAQLERLHERLQPAQYRVALICAPEIAGGFCAGHVPEFWQLRTVDGYYGLGVPARLRALPWPTGPSLRTISFTDLREVPWDLLGLLNVKAVLIASDAVFRNLVHTHGRAQLADPAQFEVVNSPARITPRVFFAGAVEPVASPQEAIARLFADKGVGDAQTLSFAEGWAKAESFDAAGSVRLDTAADRLDVRFEPAPHRRFLVINELFSPGWRAQIADREVAIHATNGVMRGILVPEGASHVVLHYVPVASASWSWLLRALAVFALLTITWVLKRTHRFRA